MLRLLWFAPLLIVTAVLPAMAHEGHQPLPTRGVQVDLKQGRITLSKSARDVIDVQTAEAIRQERSQRLRAYATVVAPWTKYAVVTSRLAGRVVALPVRPGDEVVPDQVLAEVESVELQTLKLDYRQALNELDLSQKILDGLEPVAKSGALPGQKLIEAQQVHAQNLNTKHVLLAKAASLGVSEEQLGSDSDAPLRMPIRSLISGVIVHADLTVGKYIEPTEHLMDVVDLSTVWVRIGVLEQDWHRVALGQSVRLNVNGLPGRAFDSKVDRLGQMLDPLTHQSVAWAEITNDLSKDATTRSANAPVMLRPGMRGQAELSWSGGKPVLMVPSVSVQSDGIERYVLVEESATKEGSEFQKVAVVVGRQSGGLTEVLAGKLLPGDRVVTRGGHELSSLFFLGVLRVGDETARSIGLKIEPASQRSVERVLSMDGAVDVLPQRRTNATTQLTGKLVRIAVDRGQAVQPGETLAEIASLELQDMQLELLRSHLDHGLWSTTLERLRSSGNAVPRRMVLETESRVRAIETKSANLRQKLLTVGLTSEQVADVLSSQKVLGTFPVRAPIAGTVVDFDRRLGEVVRADESLFEIHDLSQFWVQAFVGERDAEQVRVGQSARVRLVSQPEQQFEGVVARLGPIVGVESRMQAAWIEVSAPSSLSLQHNMSARVTLSTQRPSASLAVPLNAIVRDGLRSFVFVKKADGTFDRRRIVLGRADDRFAEVLSGLSTGEPVAVSGVAQLQTAFAAVR